MYLYIFTYNDRNVLTNKIAIKPYNNLQKGYPLALLLSSHQQTYPSSSLTLGVQGYSCWLYLCLRFDFFIHACGTCPFEARLFILGLTSVVCHNISCFRGNSHDCVWCMRDSTTKRCHNETLGTKVHTLRADNRSQTKRNIIAQRTGGLWWRFPEHGGHFVKNVWPCHENVMWCASVQR